MLGRRWAIVLAMGLWLFGLPAAGDEGAHDDLVRRIAELEREVRALRQAEDKWADWTFDFAGELRGRAIVEANTLNAYTNQGGETIYAYRKGSTTRNDYGWWDYRAQLRFGVGWRDRTSFHTFVQIGNAAWGNQAPLFGGSEETTLGNTELVIREMYAEIGMDPIPLRMKFGRFDIELGNRLSLGVESDGFHVWHRNQWFKIGFAGLRHYEGERFEFGKKNNNDEDAWALYVDGYLSRIHTLSAFGYLEFYEIPTKTDTPSNPKSPLYNIPRWNPVDYGSQGSNVWILGANWVSDWPRVKLNLEGDYQFGTIFAGDGTPDAAAIHLRGFAGFGKLDLRTTQTDVLFLSGGYGSGDDPGTRDFEGFFAPRNDFGIEEDYADEYVRRGYFAVYEHRSPGAGVPGALFEDQGTGGLENTIFTLLGYDANFQANHHYYFGVGGIWAARPNPFTGSRNIGVEVDMSIDYLFGDHVRFRIYGGHLFILGDYFRKDAYDAASIFLEWKVVW